MSLENMGETATVVTSFKFHQKLDSAVFAGDLASYYCLGKCSSKT